MRNLVYLSFLIVLMLSISCKRNPYSVDLTGIEYDVNIKRLENEIFGNDPVTISQLKENLIRDYGEFIYLFSIVTNIPLPDDELWSEGLVSFVTDKMNFEVYNDVIKKFPDLSELEHSLSEAMKHYIYYFPGDPLPDFYSFTSGFNNSIVVGDSTIAIGLDRYLGTDSRYYPMLGLYNYLTLKMTPEKIPSDCIYSLATTSWPAPDSNGGDNLLRSMLYEGKLLYFTRCMLPDESDSLIFGFTSGQMLFCQNNESQMWEYLLGNDLLFNTDPLVIKKLIGEAPFTGYFTNESPGRASVWIAFRIIEAYMKHNPGVSLKDLMNNNDYSRLLEGARYSP